VIQEIRAFYGSRIIDVLAADGTFMAWDDVSARMLAGGVPSGA
jgi:hypothetical protein